MISRRVGATLALSLIVGAGAVSNVESSVTPAEAAASVVQKHVTAAGAPVLNDWFALGSGCRAKSDVPGDVSKEDLPGDPMRPNVHRARFHLDQLKALERQPWRKYAHQVRSRVRSAPQHQSARR